MADYERSPRAHYPAYKPSRDRTSEWLNRLPSKRVDPTMPPSDTDSVFYSSDSDAESSRSVPPLAPRFPSGREERVSDGRYSNARSRATSGPVNNQRPPQSHHHSRSFSLHPTSGHRPPFRPHTSNTNVRPQEEIRILPAQRSMTPSTAGYVSSRSAQRSSHQSRTSSVLAPSPRRSYADPLETSSDSWVMKHGPPQPIAYSNSHPPSRYDMPTRDYSASGYRPHPSSKPPRQPIPGSPSSRMSLLTKENTIANSQSRTFARGIIEDNWSVIDEDEEWEKEQQRAAYRRGRTSSQSSNSPTLPQSRSRTTSSSSRSNYYAPGPKAQMSVSFLFHALNPAH